MGVMSGTIRKIPIEKIRNYHENPRHDIGTNERDTLRKLFDAVGTQHMINLAEDIYKNGLMGGQQITVVAVENSQNYIVYEGNRRLAALKLLSNPDYFDFLDTTTINRVKKLIGNNRTISQVDCYVTDEDEAFFIMERRHSGEDKGRGVRPWKSREKEAFFSRRSNKKNISFIIDESIRKHFDNFDITTIVPFTTVTRLFGNKAVRAIIGYDLMDVNSFTKERMQLVIDAAKWAVKEAEQAGSSVTRYFNKAQVIEATLVPWIINYTMSFTNAASVHISVQPTETTQTETASHEEKVNRVETKAAVQAKTCEANTTLPQTQAANAPSSISPTTKTDENKDSSIQTNSAGSEKNLPYFFQGIDFSHLDPKDAASHGVSAVCHELSAFSEKKLVNSFPLAATFLTRSIIEQSLIYYSKKHTIQGQNKLIWDNISQITNLSKIIDNYKKNLPNYIPDQNIRQYFSTLFDNYQEYIDPLNWVVHRPFEFLLDTKSLIELPRKGLVALINYLIA